MSSALDKLKALNDKLEAKLTEQDKSSKKTSTPSKSKPAKRASEEANPVDEAAEAISYAERGDALIARMELDPKVEVIRAENLYRVAELYVKLKIIDKAPDIENLFIYKAMNISGIGLKEEDFGEIRAGKYIQVIAITYEPDKNGKKKAKNISLGYFGKAETLEEAHKNEIIEFVLRWRYEKAFQNLEHYKDLLDRVRPNDRLF